MRSELGLNMPGLRAVLADALAAITQDINEEICAVGGASWTRQPTTADAVMRLTDLAIRIRCLIDHLEPVDEGVEAVVEGRSHPALSGSVRQRRGFRRHPDRPSRPDQPRRVTNK